MTTTALSANGVSQRLRARGIRTGYRYTQTGYRDHAGARVTAPGVMITRKARHRYDGDVDGGAVFVYPIADADGVRTDPEHVARVEVALTDAGLRFTRTRSGSCFTVEDPR